MNKARKGYTKEKKIRDERKADGWLICFKSIRWRFGCIDFATIFDIVAFKGQQRKYISSKHFNGYYLEHQDEIKKFKDMYGKDGESYELWIWKSPRWEGRGNNKVWFKGGFLKLVL